MAKSPSCLTHGLGRVNPPRCVMDVMDHTEAYWQARTPPTLLQSVIYSKKCSTYRLYQICDLFCWLYRQYGEFLFVRTSYTGVQTWYEILKHLKTSVSHSWHSVFAASVSSALCYLDIWVFSMINPSYVLHRTRPNLYSAGSTKSFQSLPVREVVSRTECSHARKLCQGLLWMD